MKTDRMNPGMGHDPMSSDSSHMQLLNHGAIDFLEGNQKWGRWLVPLLIWRRRLYIYFLVKPGLHDISLIVFTSTVATTLGLMYVMVKPGVQQLNSDIIIVGGDFRKWTLLLCQIYMTVMICTFFNFYQVIKGYTWRFLCLFDHRLLVVVK